MSTGSRRVWFNDHALKRALSAPSCLHLGTGAELGPAALSCDGADTPESPTLAGAPATAFCVPGGRPPDSPKSLPPQTSFSSRHRPPTRPPRKGRRRGALSPSRVPAREARPARAGNLCPSKSLKSIFSARHPSPTSEAGGRGGDPAPARRVCRVCLRPARVARPPPLRLPPPRPGCCPSARHPAGRRGPTWARKRSC